jgi:hypothetical protein
MTLNRNFRRTGRESLARAVHGPARRVTKVVVSVITAVALGGLALVLSFSAHAAAPPAGPLWGTLDTQTGTAAAEDKAGVTMAMFELNWASFEPGKGQFSAS